MERRNQSGLLARLANFFGLSSEPRPDGREIKIYDSGVGNIITPGMLYRLMRPQRYQAA
jgi:hypothetical protein